jgi:TM2 domain-containing membrane protein YozV
MAEKNMIIALVLSFFVTGLGNVYNGLTMRGLVEFVIAIVLGLLNMYVSSIFVIIALLWALYVLYDTYQCTNAINNNETIPLLLTQIDLQ